MKFLKFSLVFFLLTRSAYGAVYYLDAINGEDINGDGSLGAPWKTFNKVKQMVTGGDYVYLKTGDYGEYTESNVTRSDWITYEAMSGESVHIDYINIVNSSPRNTYLRFNGVSILPDDVTQTIDPQLSSSTQSTYNKTETAVTITNVNHFQINNSLISGRNHWYTTELFYATSCNYITVENNEFKTAWHAIRFITTGSNNSVIGNNIHDLTGSAINTVGLGYSNMLYERNYIHDTDIYPYTEDYSPKASGADIHGSCMSIRDGNTTIRNNIMRRCGSSSGVMFYEDDAGNDYVNENILMENNLIYDTPAYHPVRALELGQNVIIRNNIIIGEDYGSGRYQFRTAMNIEGIDGQNGTPSMRVYNNIFIGIFDLNTYAQYVDMSNNIFWSISDDTTWLCNSDLPNDYVYSCRTSTPSNPQAEMEALFPNEPNLTFVDQHGLVLNLSMSTTSIAYNFGDSGFQAPDSLGSIVNGFIQNDGMNRSTVHHSAGAYETSFGIGVPRNLRISD